MSTDDAADKTLSLTLVELKDDTPTSQDTVSATSRDSLNTGESLSLHDSGPSKPADNGQADQDIKEKESRDIPDTGEVANKEREGAVEGAEPSSGSFAESREPSEATESVDAVLAWSPEEDHEHKRVKVSRISTSCLSLLRISSSQQPAFVH